VRLKTRAHSCTNGKHKMEILSWETDSRRNQKKQPSGTAALSQTRKNQEKAAANRKFTRIIRAGTVNYQKFLRSGNREKETYCTTQDQKRNFSIKI
jgi:hypothetical protein